MYVVRENYDYCYVMCLTHTYTIPLYNFTLHMFHLNRKYDVLLTFHHVLKLHKRLRKEMCFYVESDIKVTYHTQFVQIMFFFSFSFYFIYIIQPILLNSKKVDFKSHFSPPNFICGKKYSYTKNQIKNIFTALQILK